MAFPKPPIPPMEAKLVADLPADGEDWQFEPKWDGFRCLAFVRKGKVALQSKAGKPLERYFPEVAEALAGLPDVVLDGELLIPIGTELSFEALQMRLHPAASRIRKLAVETPARLMLFDLLQLERQGLAAKPLSERREALEQFHARHRSPDLRLSPMTTEAKVARRWLAGAGGALDGVVAKRRDLPYLSGERAMLKVKRLRTADCVVGGFRYATGKREVGSLLLGLYDEAGLLHHVGFTSNMPDRAALTRRLERLVEPPGFTGDAPGGPSRWATERSAEWQPLKPELVVEIRYDHVTGRRFRHGTSFLRWRPDKAPAQCSVDQMDEGGRAALIASALDG
jgi:ATP-dependent DNA ligase